MEGPYKEVKVEVNEPTTPSRRQFNSSIAQNSPSLELPIAYQTRTQEVDNALSDSHHPKRKLDFEEDDTEINNNSPESQDPDDILLDVRVAKDIALEVSSDSLHKPEAKVHDSDIQRKRSSKVLQDMSEIDAHMLSQTELEECFKTDFSQGLSSEEVIQRQLRDGKNTLVIKRNRHIAVEFLIALFEGFGPILWGSMALCFIAYGVAKGTEGDVYNLALGVLLLVVILAQGVIGYYQGHKSSKLMEVLKQVLPTQCVVLREGRETSVPAEELVEGDVVTIHSGFKVPADICVLRCNEVKVDNSLLTGESEPQHLRGEKTSDNPFETQNLAFYATMVVEGQFKGIVIATAQNTVAGRLVTQMSKEKPKKAALQSEINVFAAQIVVMALSIGAIIIITWAAWLNREYHGFLTPAALLVTIVSVMVACLPDGMPLAVQTTMMLIAKRMLKANVLVKSLPIIETLGASTAILTDKTGTLTENKMTVSNIWLSGQITNVFEDAALKVMENGKDASLFSQLLNVCGLCNRATVDSKGAMIGDASEVALLRFYIRSTSTIGSTSVDKLQEMNPKVNEIPFNSKNKWQASIHRRSNNGERSYSSKEPPRRSSTCVTLCYYLMAVL